jgi:hypothetical protein
MLDKPKRKTNKMRQSPGMGGGGGAGGELEEADSASAGGGGGGGAPVDAQKGVMEELANKSAYMRQVEHTHTHTHVHVCVYRWNKTDKDGPK